MALDQEIINQQLELLATHRRTLAHLLQQEAQFSAGYIPAHIANGIVETQSAIRRIKEQLRTGGVPVEDSPNDDVQSAIIAVPSRLTPQERRNRQAILAKVKTIWIAGLLDKSLAKETSIALGLTEQPDAVDLSLKKLVQELNRPPRELPAGMPIIKIFKQMGGALLFLGAPGAGKTTLLLELARDLIACAEGDENFPIPIVFNLSSWATKRPPLKDWLVEELNQRYDVPKKMAQGWVDTDALLPLLDGLDEVAVEHQPACVVAINSYRQEEQGLLPLAVCSRLAEYAMLTVKLRLQGALLVQPLTKQEIGDYLERAGDTVVGVRAALRDDSELGEMLDTPLILSIVVLAYAGKSAAEVQSTGTTDERRRHLFDAYITAMFGRRGDRTTLHAPPQTIRQLSWLANQMVQHKLTVYYIEQMQPDWLRPQQQRGYPLCVRVLTGLVGGVVGGLVGGVVGGLGAGVVRGLSYGLGGAVIGGLVFGLAGGQGSSFEHITITEALRWSWSGNMLVGVLVGGFGGVLVGAIAGVVVGGLDGVLFFGLFGALLGALFFSGRLVRTELAVNAKPNQGIRRSDLNGRAVGLSYGLGVGVVVGLSYELSYGLGAALTFGLLSGLLVYLFVRLKYGGLAVLQHYTLRWLLYRNGLLPFRDKNLILFLDYCAERIFLRKVGGGYIFVHRLLMEHFASLYSEQIDNP